MKIFSEIENQVSFVLSKDQSSFEEITEVLTDLTEFSNFEWEKLNFKEKKCVQNWLSVLSEKLDEHSSNELSHKETTNDQAEQLMNDAEAAFYSGRYKDAIQYYDQVLKLEPKWERAKEHRTQADEFMAKGYIPETMLPAEVASLFGKAQSAARVMRIKDALDFLSKAQELLREQGITRWRDGQELETQLQNSIDAEETAKYAVELFNRGRIKDAVEKLELAHLLTGFPTYKARAEQYKEIEEQIFNIQDFLKKGSDFPAVHRLKGFVDEFNELDIETQNYLQKTNLLVPIYYQIEEIFRSLAIEIKTRKNKEDYPKISLYTQQILNTILPEPASQNLRALAKLMLASLTEVQDDYLKAGTQGDYHKVIESLLIQDPLNKEIQKQYEWEVAKKEIAENKEKRQINKQERQKIINDYRWQSRIWFALSVVTGISFLAVSSYVIILSTHQNDLWITLTSFLSALPILATKLVYDQSIKANDRADIMYDKITAEEQQDIEYDHKLETEFRNKLYKTSNNKENNKK